ncbi:MAG TPA: trypsin-like peptidase domain-containing protein, partial [Gemmatirosa sp.]
QGGLGSGLHLATGGGPQRDVSGGFANIAERVTPAVVSIQTEIRPRQRALPPGHGRIPPGFEEYFHQFQQQDPEPERADGSGFLVSRDGFILTNNHVVGDAERVTVRLTDHRAFRARVIGGDPSTDVAVIKIDGSNLPIVVLGEDTTARVGDWVVAVGNPLGLDFTVTAGIVSAKGRSRADLPGLIGGTYSITDFLQTDAAINPGNSGGPLVNTRGEVIGINSAIASRTGYFSGYGFAIPISLARSVMSDLIKHGRVRAPVLGVAIDEVSPADAQVAGLTHIAGVLVRAFSPSDGSPAEKAGLEVGDVIVAVDGHPVDRVSTLQRIVRGHAPHETLAIDVMRYGTRKSFHVLLAERPDVGEAVGEAPAPAPHAPARDGPASSGPTPSGPTPSDPTSARPASGGRPPDVLAALGLAVDAIDEGFARTASLPAADRGVRVRSVSRSGPAAALIGPGTDVITDVLAPGPRRHVRTPAELEAALAGARPGGAVSLRVYGTAMPAGVRVVNLQMPE